MLLGSKSGEAVPHARPRIRLLGEVSGDFVGLPDKVVFRRAVETKVGAEVRVGDEGVQALGAFDENLLFPGFLPDRVVVHGLPHERSSALSAQVVGHQAGAKGAVDGEMESVGHRLGCAVVEDAKG